MNLHKIKICSILLSFICFSGCKSAEQDKISQEVVTLKQELEEANSKIKELTNDLSDCKSEKETKERQNRQLEYDAPSLEEKVKDLQDELDACKNRLNDIN